MPARTARLQRVAEGCDALSRWLRDAARDGWAARLEDPEGLDAMARRLVDAQAPGLSRALRKLADAGGEPAELAERVGALHLLLQSYARVERLPSGLAADVRALVGFSTQKKNVLAEGERVEDRWWILGAVETQEDELLSRRTWLFGERSARSALLLDFAPPTAPLPPRLPVASALDAEVAFYPSAIPQRGLLVPLFDEEGEPVAHRPVEGARPGGLSAHLQSLAEVESAHAEESLAMPWRRRSLALVRGLHLQVAGEGWVLADERGRGLVLEASEQARWGLLAVGGGFAVPGIIGEIEGARLRPLAVLSEERLHPLWR